MGETEACLSSGLCLRRSSQRSRRREPSSLYTFLTGVVRLRSALPRKRPISRKCPGASPNLTPFICRVSPTVLDVSRPVHSTALPTFRRLYATTRRRLQCRQEFSIILFCLFTIRQEKLARKICQLRHNSSKSSLIAIPLLMFPPRHCEQMRGFFAALRMTN